MKRLFKFHWYCGRNGDLNGLFVATREEVATLIGKDVYFGEVLGKHSEVVGMLQEKDFEDLDIPEDTVLILEEKCGSTISGFNPRDYLD